MAADAVLQDVAARIIQYHYRERKGRKSASAAREVVLPTTPPAPRRVGSVPASGSPAGSVLDYMPGPRPQTAGRPASRPPRPRIASGKPPPAKPPSSKSSSCRSAGPPETGTLPLEDSAERMSRKAAEAAAAIQTARPKISGPYNAASPATEAVQVACTGSPQLLGTTQQRECATAARQPLSPAARQGQTTQLRASASTEKMGSILRMIEELEKRAAEEARQVAPVPASAAQHRQHTQLVGKAHTCSVEAGVVHPVTRVLSAQPLTICSRRLMAAAESDPVAAGAVQAAAASKCVQSSVRGVTTLDRQPSFAGGAGAGGSQGHRPDQQSASAPASAPLPHPPAAAAGLLDASVVANSVRAKIRSLQQDVAERDSQIAALRQQVEAVQRQHQTAAHTADTNHRAQLAEQKAEAEARAASSMQLIESLMKDKDALSAKCARLSADVSAAQAESAKQIEALKEGLARELRKQKEVWVAAERTKREAWMADQKRAIKESTIKGLEPEIQRLVEVHKAEMKRAEQHHEADSLRRLQAAAAQHEEQLAAARAACAAEKAAALEAERAAARAQIKDAQSRFEVELQSVRMRLAAEHQIQLDRSDAVRREDRALMQRQAEEHEQRMAALRVEWEADKRQLVAQHQKEVDNVRCQFEADQQAWRAAASERAKRELEGREAAWKRQLAAERDEELAAVVARLEEDALSKEEEMQRQLASSEASAEARWRAEVSRLRSAESSLAEKCAAAEASAAAADARVGRLEELVHTLQRELSSKGSSLSRLEDQLAASRKEAANQREAASGALQDAQEQHKQALAALQQTVAATEERERAVAEELAALRQRRVQDVDALEGRFRALLQTKDGTIASLTQQLQELHAAVC